MAMKGKYTITELTELTNRFVKDKGWYDATSSHPQTPVNIAKSLVIEAAEILELFQWQEQTGDKQQLAAEIADVTLYLLQLAYLSGVDLEQAVLDKLDLNYRRDW